MMVVGRNIIFFFGPESPSTHKAFEMDWHIVRHIGVAPPCARWPVAVRPNVFHLHGNRVLPPSPSSKEGT